MLFPLSCAAAGHIIWGFSYVLSKTGMTMTEPGR